VIAFPIIAFLTWTVYDLARDLSAHQSGQHEEYDPTCSFCRAERAN